MRHKLIKNFETSVVSIKEDYQVPGIAAGLIFDNNLEYSKGFGKSKIEGNNAVTPDTVFSIQSLTKSFTATAIMQLSEKGMIDLEAPVVDLLPYFRVRNLKDAGQITIKQLLSHTAGFPEDVLIASLQDRNLYKLLKDLPHYTDVINQFPIDRLDQIKSKEDVTRYFAHVELAYPPGEGWRYCTDAYVIAGDLIEKVTGVSWSEYVKTNIFQRLGMTNTFSDLKHIESEENVAHYYTIEDGKQIELPPPVNPICAPAGFIYSTVRDISDYLIAHMNGKDDAILTNESIQAMQKMIAKREPGLSYGLGWKIRMVNDTKIVEHGGGYPGIAIHCAMIPNKKFGVILFANNDRAPLRDLCENVVDQYIKWME